MERWFAAFLVSVLLYSPQTSSAEALGFSTSGYIRYGYGHTRNRSTHTCYRAKGAHGASRFGNECNQYMDFQLKHDLGKKDGIYLHSEIGWDFYAEEGGTLALVKRDERFLQLHGLGEVSLWAGRRTYRRKEAHLLDFKYSNLWGEGFGWEDAPLLRGHWAYAYLSRPAEEGDIHSRHITHDFRVYDLPIDILPVQSATLELSANYAEMKPKPGYFDRQTGFEGFSLNAVLDQQFRPGVSHKLSLQTGSGALADLDSRPSLRRDREGDPISPDNYRTVRVVSESLIENLDRASIMLTQLFEKRWVLGTQDSGFTWGSLGGRVKLYQSDAINYVLDGSVDYVRDGEVGVSSLVKKLSVALQFSRGRGFYNRPALRLYATYAELDDDYALTTREGLSESGVSCGIQFETWW